MSHIHVIKASGEKEIFNPEKLANSLARAGANADAQKKVVDHIERELVNGLTTSDIYRHAFSVLKKIGKPTASRYSMRRALFDFGPTGFLFERFMAEYFKKQGLETKRDQIVHGKCAPHELDVIAYNASRLIVTEVKFHNQPGLKSDLKIVLYVKARLDDLSRSSFTIKGAPENMTEGWIVTNTKFTNTAIDYASCAGIELLGWNYPPNNNLQNIIEKHQLHPISLLHSLVTHYRQVLYSRGIVLCQTIKDNPKILEEIGLPLPERALVMEEINSLFNSYEK